MKQSCIEEGYSKCAPNTQSFECNECIKERRKKIEFLTSRLTSESGEDARETQQEIDLLSTNI